MGYTTVYSYPKAWKIENRIYGFWNYTFPRPLDPQQILYFAVVLLCVLGLSKVIPPVARMPWVIRFAIIPYASGNFLLKKKLDGKSPIRYFLSWVQFQLRRGQYMERFSFRAARQPKERFRWYCAKGTLR